MKWEPLQKKNIPWKQYRTEIVWERIELSGNNGNQDQDGENSENNYTFSLKSSLEKMSEQFGEDMIKILQSRPIFQEIKAAQDTIQDIEYNDYDNEQEIKGDKSDDGNHPKGSLEDKEYIPVYSKKEKIVILKKNRKYRKGKD